MPRQIHQKLKGPLLYFLQLRQTISITSNRQLLSAELVVRQRQEKNFVERAIDMMEMFASCEDEVEADRTICAQPSAESG